MVESHRSTTYLIVYHTSRRKICISSPGFPPGLPPQRKSQRLRLSHRNHPHTGSRVQSSLKPFLLKPNKLQHHNCRRVFKHLVSYTRNWSYTYYYLGTSLYLFFVLKQEGLSLIFYFGEGEVFYGLLMYIAMLVGPVM